jgi:hypothetical protein
MGVRIFTCSLLAFLGSASAFAAPPDCGRTCRFPVVDEEAGMVLDMVIFIRPPGSTIRQNLLTEWFVTEEP